MARKFHSAWKRDMKLNNLSIVNYIVKKILKQVEMKEIKDDIDELKVIYQDIKME